jgi:hypothetical protein
VLERCRDAQRCCVRVLLLLAGGQLTHLPMQVALERQAYPLKQHRCFAACCCRLQRQRLMAADGLRLQPPWKCAVTEPACEHARCCCGAAFGRMRRAGGGRLEGG